ncbi:MAG: hypothetical protein KF832_06045 [Caldilineaceae bacterium]|nr:hypothetical protein [Caldilineaceae bacterium]
MNQPLHFSPHRWLTKVGMALLGLGLLGSLLAFATVHADTPATTGIYLPLVVNAHATPTPTSTAPAQTPPPSFTPTATAPPTATTPPPTPVVSLPAELVGRWFVGNAPLNDFYNPQTGEWQDTNGLGQMYSFADDGAYTYTGFLRLQNGQCRSEVSVYKQGIATATDTNITLHQNIAKTRTVVICPTPQESITEETTVVTTLAWAITYDAGGRQQLSLSEGATPTVYARQGMEPTLVGGWRRGDITATGFFDTTTNTFAPEPGVGSWFRFTSDGHYQFGEFGYGQDNAGCSLTGWIYQEGTLEVAGSRLTTTPTNGMVRVENECQPEAPHQAAWLDPINAYTWQFFDRNTAPKLVLIPLAHYMELTFLPE